MSDTPIDWNLTNKKSLRLPLWFDTRAEEFREEHNDAIRGLDHLDEEVREQFLLDSTSDAYRRLLDFGFAYWVEHSLPFGFAFEPGDIGDADTTFPVCPNCGETDEWLFRVGAAKDDDGITFDNVRCLACDHNDHTSEFTQ